MPLSRLPCGAGAFAWLRIDWPLALRTAYNPRSFGIGREVEGMQSERLDALRQLRDFSDGLGGGGGTVFMLVFLALVALITLASLFWLFAAPVVLMRMNARLKTIERRLEVLIGGKP